MTDLSAARHLAARLRRLGPHLRGVIESLDELASVAHAVGEDALSENLRNEIANLQHAELLEVAASTIDRLLDEHADLDRRWSRQMEMLTETSVAEIDRLRAQGQVTDLGRALLPAELIERLWR